MDDMTTAEMVTKCKRIADGSDERLRCKEAAAIAARLEALDRVAKAGQSVVDAVGSRHGRIVALGEALKEAGYGK